MWKRLAETIQKFSLTRLIKMADQEAKDLPNHAQKRQASPVETKSSSKKKKKHVVQLGQSEGCKRKVAMLMAYNGSGYYGVQVNPGFPTIESELFKALVKVEGIPQDHCDTPSKMWFQRGSRTDKGVSASGQIFSFKVVLVPDLVSKLNEVLPPQLKVIGYVRTTNGFDAKNYCTSRTYMYQMPTFAFAPIEKFITDEYRITNEIIDHVRKIFKKFVGTHKFHNFTSGVKYEQASASRYMISFECSDPFVREGLEFVTLRVKGQSFMLHQIRKMIGLTIAIVRGCCGESALDRSWGPEKVDIPRAPGLGLVLEALNFDGYNKKFGSDGVHDPIDWEKHEKDVMDFKEKYILSSIVATEKSDRVMFNWLQTLQFHNFDMPREEGPQKPWVKTQKILEGKSPEPGQTQSEKVQECVPVSVSQSDDVQHTSPEESAPQSLSLTQSSTTSAATSSPNTTTAPIDDQQERLQEHS